jgi:hypothetical protein
MKLKQYEEAYSAYSDLVRSLAKGKLNIGLEELSEILGNAGKTQQDLARDRFKEEKRIEILARMGGRKEVEQASLLLKSSIQELQNEWERIAKPLIEQIQEKYSKLDELNSLLIQYSENEELYSSYCWNEILLKKIETAEIEHAKIKAEIDQAKQDLARLKQNPSLQWEKKVLSDRIDSMNLELSGLELELVNLSLERKI